MLTVSISCYNSVLSYDSNNCLRSELAVIIQCCHIIVIRAYLVVPRSEFAVIIQCCHMIAIRAYLVVARSELAVIIQCCHMIVIRAYSQS